MTVVSLVYLLFNNYWILEKLNLTIIISWSQIQSARWSANCINICIVNALENTLYRETYFTSPWSEFYIFSCRWSHILLGRNRDKLKLISLWIDNTNCWINWPVNMKKCRCQTTINFKWWSKLLSSFYFYYFKLRSTTVSTESYLSTIRRYFNIFNPVSRLSSFLFCKAWIMSC